MIQRGHHDMGGLPAGKVERNGIDDAHDYAEWERRVDALSMLLRVHGVTVDERRRHIEAIPPAAYDAMSYYERWIVSLVQALLQRGVVTSEELARKMVEVESRAGR